jgi:hypothetical protein
MIDARYRSPACDHWIGSRASAPSAVASHGPAQPRGAGAAGLAPRAGARGMALGMGARDDHARQRSQGQAYGYLCAREQLGSGARMLQWPKASGLTSGVLIQELLPTEHRIHMFSSVWEHSTISMVEHPVEIVPGMQVLTTALPSPPQVEQPFEIVPMTALCNIIMANLQEAISAPPAELAAIEGLF